MITFPSAEDCRVFNSSVIFHQGTEDHPDEDKRHPAYMEILGVLVFFYLDSEDKALRISADFDNADTGSICRNDEQKRIPVEFAASGEVVFRG